MIGIPPAKRIFDLLATSLLLIILSPVLLLISLVLLVINGTPLLYRQRRPGFKGKPFYLYKFRTMNDRYGEDGSLLTDAERITPLGRCLRTSSLDELPEFFNVLRGEMSLVGPRPLLMQYMERYSPEQRRRHEVLPGVTGWAQVNGRNAITWSEKFRLDVWYVENWSFWLDIKILLMTVWKVLKGEGINQPGHATAEEFMGNE